MALIQRTPRPRPLLTTGVDVEFLPSPTTPEGNDGLLPADVRRAFNKLFTDAGIGQVRRVRNLEDVLLNAEALAEAFKAAVDEVERVETEAEQNATIVGHLALAIKGATAA